MLRKIKGRLMAPSTSVNKITPVARKISKSRSGNGVPSLSATGIDKAAASVTAPRIPAMVVARLSNLEGASAIFPS